MKLFSYYERSKAYLAIEFTEMFPAFSNFPAIINDLLSIDITLHVPSNPRLESSISSLFFAT